MVDGFAQLKIGIVSRQRRPGTRLPPELQRVVEILYGQMDPAAVLLVGRSRAIPDVGSRPLLLASSAKPSRPGRRSRARLKANRGMSIVSWIRRSLSTPRLLAHQLPIETGCAKVSCYDSRRFSAGICASGFPLLQRLRTARRAEPAHRRRSVSRRARDLFSGRPLSAGRGGADGSARVASPLS